MDMGMKRNRDASLFPRTRLRGTSGGSASGARHGSAGRVAIAGNDAPLREAIRLGRGRCISLRSTAVRDRSAHRNSRASSIAPPGGEGWTIRDHRAILHSEPYASADLGAASDVTGKSIWSEAASASSPRPI